MFINLPIYFDATTQYLDINLMMSNIFTTIYDTNINYDLYFSNVAKFETNFFLNLLNESNILNEIENIKTIYHYSIPNTKLYYPEPFLAAASFMHTDLWFVHILIYQY